MANRDFSNAQTYERYTTFVPFSFAPNNTSAVDQDSILGKGIESVAYAGSTGHWDVVLEDKFVALICLLPYIMKPSGANYSVELVSYDVSTRTARIRVCDETGAADSLDNTNRVGGCFVFQDATYGS